MADWIGVDMTDITWLPVLGHEGRYEVSSNGRVRSLDRMQVDRIGRKCRLRGRELKNFLSAYGYQRVSIPPRSDENPNTYQRDVHRLMCEAFHGPAPFGGAVVRHLNGIRTDNRPENLRWGTPAENTADMFRHGTHVEQRKTHCEKGHEFNDANTHTSAKGHRRCRICGAEAKRREKARRGAPMKTGIYGVMRTPYGGWRVNVWANGRHRWGGVHATAAEAEAARDRLMETYRRG